MIFTRNNPTLKADLYARFRGIPLDAAGTMTVEGTIGKSFALFGVALLFAAFNWFFCYQINPAAGIIASIIGMFAALGVAIWTSLKPQDSPISAPIYAAVEGIVLGGISALYNARYAGIVHAAIPLTFAIFFAMLALYRTGVIKASPLYVKTIVICTLGICLFGFINLMVWFMTGQSFFVPGDVLSIAVSLFICAIAALYFVIDFEFIQQGPEVGAPKYMEWYGAFALCVTLFWLYFQILRLLRLLRR